MSESLVTAKYEILKILANLDRQDLESVEEWLRSGSIRIDLQKKRILMHTERTLVQIGNAIKEIVPFEAEMASETIVPPTVGDNADCTKANSCHVDEFLYDDEQMEKLVEEGKVKQHYCLDCESRNVKDIIFISHSMSIKKTEYIFKVLLPKSLEGKKVLDIGSRIGAVLYGAYYFSNADKIIGVEMNKECCEVQEQMINKFSMNRDRIKVVHSDIMERSDIVANSNVIIINVHYFFVDNETHKKMWIFFMKHIKKGSYLVCNRNIADILESIGLCEELLNSFSVCRPNQQNNEIFFDIEDYSELNLYTIL